MLNTAAERCACGVGALPAGRKGRATATKKCPVMYAIATTTRIMEYPTLMELRMPMVCDKFSVAGDDSSLVQ